MPITGILSQVIVFHDQRNRLKIGNLIVAESNRIQIDAANRNTVRECHLCGWNRERKIDENRLALTHKNMKSYKWFKRIEYGTAKRCEMSIASFWRNVRPYNVRSKIRRPNWITWSRAAATWSRNLFISWIFNSERSVYVFYTFFHSVSFSRRTFGINNSGRVLGQISHMVGQSS